MELITTHEQAAEQLSLFDFLHRVHELQTMPYREYLQTPEWAQVRQLKLSDARYRCQLNANHWRNLEVHHRTYVRRGVELLCDLIVLCADCHGHVHKFIMGEPPGAPMAAAA